MAKSRTRYVCTDCGGSASKWAGQCADCGSWNTLVESIAPERSSQRSDARSGYAGDRSSNLVSLGQIEQGKAAERFSTGDGEMDRVLGGGLVPGSVVLLGGDPGIGKSTLLLQVCAALAPNVPVLYVSGEESANQIAMRGRRLQLELDPVQCLTETCVEQIVAAAEPLNPSIMVIDSIQTLYTEQLSSAPGSVAQVRESAAAIVRFAKRRAMSVFLVGHVTKEGGIAGPRVLEHMVDTVLYFESQGNSRHRVVRSLKNRFGAANELGVFGMTETGLRPVSNPSAIFLSGHPGDVPGSVITVTWEGTRPLLMELQALVAESYSSHPKRIAVGLDSQRLAMLLAVLNRIGGLAVHDQDVFINAVGGVRITETAADLPLLLAIASSLADRAPAKGLVAFGEVGLAGEIRPVPFGEERLREAAKQGFKRALVAKENMPRGNRSGFGDLQIRGVSRLDEALDE